MTEEMQLELPIQRHMPIRRYALFTDFRGVFYCEPVDEMLQVYEFSYRERLPLYRREGFKRKMIHPYRPAGKSYEVVFDPTLCNRSDYCHTTRFDATALIEEGYVRSEKRVYLQENYWAQVDAIDITTDLEKGKRLQEMLWQLTPEGNRMIGAFDNSGLKHRDNKAKPFFIPTVEQLIAA